MNQFTAIPFKHWYKSVKGSSIEIAFDQRTITVFNSNNEKITSLDFASKIDSKFDLADLFNDDFHEPKYEYYVFPSEPLFSEMLWRIETRTL